jgi:hypothetical protein
MFVCVGGDVRACVRVCVCAVRVCMCGGRGGGGGAFRHEHCVSRIQRTHKVSVGQFIATALCSGRSHSIDAHL